jgi:hypothetical protein
MPEPGSTENVRRPIAPKNKVLGINDTPDEIRDHVNSHVHKSVKRQGVTIFGVHLGKQTTTTDYDSKGIIEDTRPPPIFRRKRD